MALHTELPIYRTGVQLLALAIQAQQQMPRGVKRSLGDKIATHCVEMLDLMALANATKAHERARHIQALLTHRRTTVASAESRLRTLPHDELPQSANSYFGLLSQAPCSHGDRARLARALLGRGKAVRAHDLGKAFR